MAARAHCVYCWRLPAALALVAASSALAQTSSPNRIQTTQSQAAGQPTYTLRAQAPLTIVDVVVTDAKGNFVHGLKQSDFTILEDNKEMMADSFEEHRTDNAPAPSPTLTAAKQALAPNSFSNINPINPGAPSHSSINVLLLDSMNTPTQVQQIVLREMLDFIKKSRPGTLMTVISLSTRLAILQGLTTDPELLRAAIAKAKNTVQPLPMEDRDQDPARADDPPSPLTCSVELEHAALRGQYTLSAMRQLARYLSGMPGRKNLIWLSGSFGLTASCPDGDAYDFTADMQAATDLLARAHVVISPIDPRAMDCFAGGPCSRKKGTEDYTMADMADRTGGKGTFLSNGLSEAAEDAVESGSNFYTLTYTPTNQTLDTRFRTIMVKVSQPGLHLAYRPGYYAVEPDVDVHGKKIETATPMQAAMMRGALDATQIFFKVNVVQSPSTEVTLPVSNKPDAKQMKPPYRHYSLAFLVDVNNIAFTPGPDGNYRGDFEFGVNVYNADGDEIVNSASKTVSPILPPAVYQSMLRGGANAHLDIDVPASGDYFLRIAVHDLTSDRIGAIEVPTASITPDKAPAVASQK